VKSKQGAEKFAAYMRRWYWAHRELVRARQSTPRAKSIRERWKKKNAEKLKAQRIAYDQAHRAEKKAYREAHAAEIKSKKKAYYRKNKKRIIAKVRTRWAEKKDEINAHRLAAYHALPPDEKKARNRAAYAALDPENRRKKAAAYYQANKASIHAANQRRDKERQKRDPAYKLSRWCRLRIRQALKFYKTSATASKLLGCTVAEFRAHLESQFKPGMTWTNWTRDGWHIDHIRPLASFDLTKASERSKAFHWRNHQPLWWRDNLSKGARVR
jgi:hypothetical protein